MLRIFRTWAPPALHYAVTGLVLTVLCWVFRFDQFARRLVLTILATLRGGILFRNGKLRIDGGTATGGEPNVKEFVLGGVVRLRNV